MARAFNILPLKTPVDTNGGSMNREWYPWFQNASNAVNSLYQSGTSAERPTTNVYLGQLYFDMTLGTLIMLTDTTTLNWVPFATTVSALTPDTFVFTNALGNIITDGVSATNGQLLIGSTGATPQVGTLTGTANEVIVTNGPGSITLSLPQAIAQTSSPTFAGITDTSLIQNGFLTIGASGLLQSTAAATNGQLLIGSSSGAPVAANLTAGTGLSVTNGAGSITLANTGVTSNVAGTGISVSSATGAVTINNTGVTSLTAGSGISLSGSTGAVTVSVNGTGVVTSITGTANEIIASSSTGNITLSTPQPIGTSNSPTFSGLTLSGLTGYLYGNGGSGITASTTIPNTSITGLGTMSTQNASSVAITGGSINGTTVGATTPSTGDFTTLSASTSATVPTVAQFNNTTNAASTAFVQRALGNKQTNYAYNTSQTITLSQAGAVIQSFGSGITFTMPLANTIPVGAEFDFVNNSGGTLTIAVNNISTDSFVVGVTNVTSITLQIGDTLHVVGTGNTYMFVTGGSGTLQYSSTHYNNPTFSGTISGMPGRLLAIRTLSNGTYTPTTGTNTVLVKMQAPGGAGGGTAATSSGQYAAGSSGGAGAYVEALFTVGTLSGSTVSLGTAGAGSAGATGGAGSSATFGSAISCPGGSGGFAGSAVTGPSATFGPAATGSPTVTGGTTLLAIPGIGGAAGVIFTAGSLQGIFAGGSTPIGQGSQPKWGFGANVGEGYGWGGGGYNAGASTAAQAGASGGPGYCEVWEFS